MTYTIEGTIHRIFAKEFIEENFTKKEFVLHVPDDSGGKYDQTILFQTSNKSMTILEGISEGDAVEITFDIKGKVGKNNMDKFYNTLRAYKLRVI